MRLLCLHIPRRTVTEANAYYDTAWELVNPKYLWHFLDDVSEAHKFPFSLEMYATRNMVYICIASSEKGLETFKGGIYSFLPEAELHPVNDYTEQIDPKRTAFVAGDVRLQRSDIYPVENFYPFATDTMNAALAKMSALPLEDNLLVQLICVPVKRGWGNDASQWLKRKFVRTVDSIRPYRLMKHDLPSNTAKRVNEKSLAKLYHANIRISSFTERPSEPRLAEQTMKRLRENVSEVAGLLSMVNLVAENGLYLGRLSSNAQAIARVKSRSFVRPYRLSAIEVASLVHPPTLGSLPNTAEVLSRKGLPPRHAPNQLNAQDASIFAQTNHHSQSFPFGIKRKDRRHHLYVVGSTGTGKSSLLQLFLRSDIQSGHGCAIIDPHGDLVDSVLRYIPSSRLKDVVVLDVADPQFCSAFNPLAARTKEESSRVVLSVSDAFQHVFPEIWSDKLEIILRYSLLALTSNSIATFLLLRRFLAEEEFRHEIVQQCTDDAARRFWQHEYAARRNEFDESAISPLLNRIDNLLASEVLRNTLGQSSDLFDFRSFMDSGKIVLLRLTKGAIGVENSTFLGMLLVWRMYFAALSRADIPLEQRRDFFLFIDEFQNFATAKVGEILSESRKYHLSLTMCNQFLYQIPEGVRKAIFGNVGNVLSFRVGPEDVGAIAKEMQPKFTEQDVLGLGPREFYLKMVVDGDNQEPFSGYTLDLPDENTGIDSVRKLPKDVRERCAIAVSKAEEERALMEMLPASRLVNAR